MNKKKKIIMITISIIIIVLLLAISFTGNNKSQDKNNFNSNNSVDNNIENEIIANDDSKTIEDTNTNEKNVENNSQIVEEPKNIVTEDTGTLPSDAGLTVSGVSRTFNQDIISQANIAYLLGCENITETTNFEDYINKNITKNGIFISNVSGYTKTDNPYDFIKENTVFMKELLSAIGFSYDIENNYLVDNKSTSELESKINKVISGNKKVIIGFLPEYYVYINDMDNGLGFGGYSNSSYISLKPYDNIYTFIFDFNSSNKDDFFSMMEEIANLAD